jgi:hypothetical protein
MNKCAFHPEERAFERLKLDPSSVAAIKADIDKMWFARGQHFLKGDHFYSRINDNNMNLLGYAAMKRVNTAAGKRPRLVLSTFLHKSMRPRGTDISHLINSSVHLKAK